jgi:hypothetical protein
VVVAVGLTVVDPLADVDVNVPGVMAMFVAPVVTQLNVLLVPVTTLTGFAVKEVIAGALPSPVVEPNEDTPPQLAIPRQAIRTRTRAQSSSLEESDPWRLSCLLENESGEFIHDPSLSVGHTSRATCGFGSQRTVARPPRLRVYPESRMA